MPENNFQCTTNFHTCISILATINLKPSSTTRIKLKYFQLNDKYRNFYIEYQLTGILAISGIVWLYTIKKIVPFQYSDQHYDLGVMFFKKWVSTDYIK
jgi:hypothetical protein